MKASELEKEIQSAIEEHGDCEIIACNKDWDNSFVIKVVKRIDSQYVQPFIALIG